MIEVDLTLWVGRALPVRFTSSARRLGILGPSGVGKSTLLASLAGLTRAPGRVALDSQELNSPWVPSWRRNLGVVFQDGRVFPHRTVLENLAFAGTPSDELIDVLELRPLLKRRTAALSGGERRRVALGRAVASCPRMLLLDEPFAGLDGPLARRIAAWLLAQDLPFILVSHHTAEMQRLTDEVVVLGRDGVTGVGRLDQLDVEHVENCLPITLVSDGPTALVQAGQVQIAVAGPCSGGAILIRPEDVLVASGEVGRLSARNVLRGRVVSRRDVGGRVLVELDVGVKLWAEVTAGAVEELGLEPGRAVAAIVKATAIKWA